MDTLSSPQAERGEGDGSASPLLDALGEEAQMQGVAMSLDSIARRLGYVAAARSVLAACVGDLRHIDLIDTAAELEHINDSLAAYPGPKIAELVRGICAARDELYAEMERRGQLRRGELSPRGTRDRINGRTS